MNLLPEYNEILYHAKVCSELEFREYWNEVQSRLSVEVTDEEIDKQADYKYDNTSIQRSAWIGGAKWMRDRLTQPQSDAIALLERAASLVGNPGTNISGSTDVSCMNWQKDYELYKASKDMASHAQNEKGVSE